MRHANKPQQVFALAEFFGDVFRKYPRVAGISRAVDRHIREPSNTENDAIAAVTIIASSTMLRLFPFD